MASRRLLYGGASNINTVLLQSQRVPSSSSEPLNSLFIPASSPSFLGSGSGSGSISMVSFEDVNGRKRPDKSFFRSFDQEEIGDDDLDEYLHQPEKKRRLKASQVEFLEKSFEAENKLEPERKIQLAKDLGLQPRQVAIWFQNRRARWKNKQLEKDYDVLQASYNSLKADYDNLLKDKEKLKDEILHLTDKVLVKERETGNSKLSETKTLSEVQRDSEVSKDSIMAKQEDLNSAKSDVFDSDSPHYHTDGGHSSLLEPGDSSYVFDPEQSDLSQDEEDNLSNGLLPPPRCAFPKIEDGDYLDQPANSYYFGFPVDDHTFGLWS